MKDISKNKMKLLIRLNSLHQSSLNFPPESVYLKAIQLLNNNKYYRYDKESGGTATYKLSYKSDQFTWNLSKAYLKEEEIKDIQDRHEELANTAKKEYEKDIKSIIDVEEELNSLFKELKYSLEDLTNYIEYKNMICEYVK